MSDKEKETVSDEQLENVTGGVFTDWFSYPGGGGFLWQCSHPEAKKEHQQMIPGSDEKVCPYYSCSGEWGPDEKYCCNCKYFSKMS